MIYTFKLATISHDITANLYNMIYHEMPPFIHNVVGGWVRFIIVTFMISMKS